MDTVAASGFQSHHVANPLDAQELDKVIIIVPGLGQRLKTKTNKDTNKTPLFNKVPQIIIGRSHFSSPSTVLGKG